MQENRSPLTVHELQAEIESLKEEIVEKEKLIKELESRQESDKLKEDGGVASIDDGQSGMNENQGDVKECRMGDEIVKLQVIYSGEGEGAPAEGDVVKMHFTIALESDPDHIIEDSRDRYGGVPFSFIVGKDQVIDGFQMALVQMRRGEVSTCMLPSHVAYGEDGFGGSIPCNEDLRCHIELIDFYKHTAPVRPFIVHLKPPKNMNM